MPAAVTNPYQHVMAGCDRSAGKDACWPWTRSCNRAKAGYGRIKSHGRNLLTHRVVWEHSRRRRVPSGKRVLHHCDNPPCCNPRHLFLGTQKQNVQDMRKKGRAVYLTCEEHGSARLTAAQVRRVFLDPSAPIDIHRKTGIPKSTIHHILGRTHWRPVTRDLTAPVRPESRGRRPGVVQAFAKMAAEEGRVPVTETSQKIGGETVLRSVKEQA